MTSGAPSAAARKWLVVIVAIVAIVATGFGLTYLFSGTPAGNVSASAHVSASKTAAPKAKHTGTRPLWSELTPSLQEALAPLSPEWDQINSVRKKKWLELGNKMIAMPPEERQRLQGRMREWVKLTPEQRRIARANYAQTKKIKPAEKEAQWQEYQKLPEEKKRELAAIIERAKKQVANPPLKRDQNAKTVPPIKVPAKPAAGKTTQPETPTELAPANLPIAP